MKGEYLKLVEEFNTGVQKDDKYVSEFSDENVLAKEADDAVVPEIELDAVTVVPYFRGWFVAKLADDSDYGSNFSEVSSDFRADFGEVYGEKVNIDDTKVTLDLITGLVKGIKNTNDSEDIEDSEDKLLTEPVEMDDMETMDSEPEPETETEPETEEGV